MTVGPAAIVRVLDLGPSSLACNRASPAIPDFVDCEFSISTSLWLSATGDVAEALAEKQAIATTKAIAAFSPV